MATTDIGSATTLAATPRWRVRAALVHVGVRLGRGLGVALLALGEASRREARAISWPLDRDDLVQQPWLRAHLQRWD